MFFRLLHIKSAKPLRNARRINNNNSSLQIIQLLCTFLELHTRFLLNSCRQTIIIIAVDFQTFSEFKDSIHNFRRNNRRYKSHGEFFEIQATGMKKKRCGHLKTNILTQAPRVSGSLLRWSHSLFPHAQVSVTESEGSTPKQTCHTGWWSVNYENSSHSHWEIWKQVWFLA